MIEIPFWLFILMIFLSAPVVFAIIALICVGICMLVISIFETIALKEIKKRKESDDE